MDYNEILDRALEILDQNDEWEKRYGGYIGTIMDGYYSKQVKFIKSIVQVNWPMAAYTSISGVTQSGITLDLRLLGTSIATLNVASKALGSKANILIKEEKNNQIDKSDANKKVTVSFKKKAAAFDSLIGKGKNNSQIVKSEFIDHGWDTKLIEKLLEDENKKYNWHDPLIEKFRSMVKKVYEDGGFVISGEHAYESSILHLMKGNSKYFYSLKPILLEGSFFQMPTPFKGSESKDDDLSYAAQNGGGIDILARKRLGAKNELCVIELKDNYEKGEEPVKAIKQAIVYSVFILRLINSDVALGDKWLDYFGIHSKRDNININAVISMPFKLESRELLEEDMSFAAKELKVAGLGTITLHYMYFDKDILEYDQKYDADKIKISVPRNKSNS